MTFSPLISGTLPHHGKYSSREGRAITRMVDHHWAASGWGGRDRLTNPNEQASANYLIYSDGRIMGQVPEEYRAWTSGSWEADAGSITVEIQNTGGQVNGKDNDPKSWPISGKAFDALVRLTADIARRYGWGSVTRARVKGHREVALPGAGTACPGGYLWANLSRVAREADALLNTPSDSAARPDSAGSTFDPALAGEQEDEMVQVFARQDGGKDGEWMRTGPEFGVDLKPGEKRTDGKVVVFEGYEVTTDRETGESWGRTHCRAFGNAPSRLQRGDYIHVQAQAKRHARSVWQLWKLRG